MNKTIAGKGEYEIIFNDVVTLITGNRDKAVSEVVRLRNAGVSLCDIYATYDCGRNYDQASKHLLTV